VDFVREAVMFGSAFLAVDLTWFWTA
jgi:hypothetical protein